MFVFRNFTVENLFPEKTTFSGYGDIAYLPKDEKELVWCYQAPINFDPQQKTNEIEHFIAKLNMLADSISTEQTLYICTLVDLYSVNAVSSDYRTKVAIEKFNHAARELSDSRTNIKIIETAEYFSLFPKTQWINWRFYFISQMIVSPAVAAPFKGWLIRKIRQANGQRKKCLVLDLDNTLWGGVLGEDGVDGIKIGGDYPGNAFLYFQEALVELSKTGVILAVCSKNNENDVLEAWEKNPFIKLEKNFISSYRINWNNKADNIREIAAELNIGLDSIVFVDDNPTERELVRQKLPMVETPEFPTKPYGLMEFYENLVDEYFQTSFLTKEDVAKTEQYRANSLRAAAALKFADMSEFIRSLSIKIKILTADSFNIGRIAQMTQKTNQFNLTTRRYSESDINTFVKSGYIVLCGSVSDRFGDSGITAAIIIRTEQETAHIDSYLLSCRILGKGIENVFLSAVLNSLKNKGIKSVTAEFIPTPKNSQVADFYDRNKFVLKNETQEGVRHYELELDKYISTDDLYEIIY